MSSDHPFALFITWTTYGTWLPGDTRAGMSRIRFFPAEAGARKRIAQRERAKKLQKWPTVWLTVAVATTVAHSLARAARTPFTRPPQPTTSRRGKIRS